MGFAALFSGGKDSAYSVYLAQKTGLDVDCLVTMLSNNPESYMFHVPNARLTSLHSEAMGIKLVQKTTMGRKEDELADLKGAVAGLGAEGLIVGAVASSYQMERVEKLCNELNIGLFAPLWHRDEEDILRNFVSDGFECVFVACCAAGFGENWLGRKLDGKAIDDLVSLKQKYKINISGEGGEYETLVLDGPNFKKRIEIKDIEKSWKNESGFMTVKNAALMEKTAIPVIPMQKDRGSEQMGSSEEHAWVDDFPAAVTVCDKDGIILEMNRKAAETFEKDGGPALIGRNALDCHPEPARAKLEKLLSTGKSNCYTIEKKGAKKLIYQTPWFKDGKYLGFVELSIEIPANMPHFKRD